MRTEQGLTLLELLVVMVILGLVSGLAATAYGGRVARQQESWATELGLLLRAARQEAMGSGRVVDVEMSKGLIAVQSLRRPLVLPVASSVRVRWTAGERDGQRTGPTFYPDGSAESGTLEIDSDGWRRRIGIDWMGGLRDADIDTRTSAR